MRLFHLVEQHHRIGLSAHRLGELTALLIADISGRCADEARHGEFFHIFAHVDAHDVLFIVEKTFRKRLGKLRLADARRSQKQERSDRAVGILNTRSGAQDSLGNARHRFILPDHAAVQDLFEMQQLVPLALHQPRYGDTRPALHDAGDLLVRHLVPQIAAVVLLTFRLRRLQLLLQRGQRAVFQLGSAVEIVVLLGAFDLRAQLFDLRTQALHLTDLRLFVFPLRLFLRQVGAQLGKLLLNFFQMRLRQLVAFLFQRRLLDFQLNDLALHHIQLGRHGVHFGADHGTCLIDEVDRLVRQKTVGDIPMGQRRSGDDGGILNFHAVIHLIALLQTAQNGDGVLHGRLLHQNRLKPSFECGILFDILAIFVERRRTDTVQLAAR